MQASFASLKSFHPHTLLSLDLLGLLEETCCHTLNLTVAAAISLDEMSDHSEKLGGKTWEVPRPDLCPIGRAAMFKVGGFSKALIPAELLVCL